MIIQRNGSNTDLMLNSDQRCDYAIHSFNRMYFISKSIFIEQCFEFWLGPMRYLFSKMKNDRFNRDIFASRKHENDASNFHTEKGFILLLEVPGRKRNLKLETSYVMCKDLLHPLDSKNSWRWKWMETDCNFTSLQLMQTWNTWAL